MIASLENLGGRAGRRAKFSLRGKYILVGKEVLEEPDLLTWGKWMQDSPDRIIARTTINDVPVSTVFLGLLHGFNLLEPLFFETMVMDGKLKGEMTRAGNYAEAVKQHRAMVEKVKRNTPLKVGEEMAIILEKEPA